MESRPIMLVVNADDLGLCEAVNDSIFTGMREGITTSASLMVNMPSATCAMAAWKANASQFRFGSGLGIHLCLTSGPASARPELIPLLVDSNGMLRLGFARLVKYLYSRHRAELLLQIERELDAQFAKADEFAERFGVEFDHVDSHQHVHVLPGISPMIEHRARARSMLLRVPCERYATWGRLVRSFRYRFPAGVVKKMILDHYSGQSLRDQMQVGYFGIVDSGHVDRDSFRSILQSVPRLAKKTHTDFFEINLHPWNHTQIRSHSLTCSEADSRFALDSQRSEEFRTVTDSQSLLEQMNQLNIQPVGSDRVRKELMA